MSEPKLTLHSQKWREARDRVHAVDAETRPVFLALLDHVGRGWQAFRPLQEWLEQNRGNARTDPDDYTHLLNFVEGEFVGHFHVDRDGSGGRRAGLARVGSGGRSCGGRRMD